MNRAGAVRAAVFAGVRNRKSRPGQGAAEEKYE